MPKRIQRKRSAGWKMPANAVYVGRPTKWGNPFVVGETYPVAEDGILTDEEHTCTSNADAVAMFRSWADDADHGFDDEEIDDLRGKDLACWCAPDQPCHADVLLEIANRDD